VSTDVAEYADGGALPAGGQAAGGSLISRRDRVRAATSQEIIQTARQLLIEHGSAAVSLRAIAREMGMTAPALYRYYDSHEVLIQHVVADIFTDLAEYLESAIGTVTDSAPPDAVVLTATKLIVACRAFRAWAISHPAEFGMIFGSPMPGVDIYHDNPLVECGARMGNVFLTLFSELWQLRPFQAPADEQIDSALRTQLAHYRDQIPSDLPLGVLLVFLRCWVILYGTVAMEAFGHMKFAVDDPAPMFELVLGDLAAMIGFGFPPSTGADWDSPTWD
jgi:AcrR family transcriptional regulator